MTTTALKRLMVTAALLVSPAAASAQASSTAMATIAQNSVATDTGTASVIDSRSAPATAVEKKICKQLPSSYSRMTQRVCLTEKEWKQAEQEAQD